MSNWLYADKVPTIKWRSAMTLPRDLNVEKIGTEYYLQSTVVNELSDLVTNTFEVKNFRSKNYSVTRHFEKLNSPLCFTVSLNRIQSFTVRISNEAGEHILMGFDKNSNEFYIDRANSGIVDFNKEFGSRSTAPRISSSEKLNVTLVLDQSSLELFADEGLSVMTALFFPKRPFSDMQILSDEELEIQAIQAQPLRNTLVH